VPQNRGPRRMAFVRWGGGTPVKPRARARFSEDHMLRVTWTRIGHRYCHESLNGAMCRTCTPRTNFAMASRFYLAYFEEVRRATGSPRGP